VIFIYVEEFYLKKKKNPTFIQVIIHSYEKEFLAEINDNLHISYFTMFLFSKY